jgi:uncharacterized membrane protein YjfL (UPF0719 family)
MNLSQLYGNSPLAILAIDIYPLAFLAIGLGMMYIAKLANDFTTPYNLAEELTQKDNKAIAVSFSGYLLATGILVWGILRQDINPELASSGQELYKTDLLSSCLWILFGIALLQVARVANDVLLLNKFCNIKELVTDKNVGTGIVQAGSYIGTALIIQAALYGEDTGIIGDDILHTLLYFAIGQVAFLLFGFVYEKTTPYNLHEEIEKDNAAAGLGYGLTLIALGMLLSSFILNHESLAGLLTWFVLSSILLPLCRIATDRLLLPGAKLNDEISKDRNWGAALIEGATAISIALILGTLF